MANLNDGGPWWACWKEDPVYEGSVQICEWEIWSGEDSSVRYYVIEEIDREKWTVGYRWKFSTLELLDKYEEAKNDGNEKLAKNYRDEIEYRSNNFGEGLRPAINKIRFERSDNPPDRIRSFEGFIELN